MHYDHRSFTPASLPLGVPTRHSAGLVRTQASMVQLTAPPLDSQTLSTVATHMAFGLHTPVQTHTGPASSLHIPAHESLHAPLQGLRNTDIMLSLLSPLTTSHSHNSFSLGSTGFTSTCPPGPAPGSWHPPCHTDTQKPLACKARLPKGVTPRHMSAPHPAV